MRIVPMSAGHWPEVEVIYQQGIDTKQATFETTTPSWQSWDQGHLMAPRLVAIENDSVVGWAALSPVSKRAVYRGVAEVSVYVSVEHQGQGIGLALLQALIDQSEKLGIWTLQAVTFPENEASVGLHQKLGFRLVGQRHKIARQHGQWRDTVLLERRSGLL